MAFHKFGVGNVDVTYCDYDDVNEQVNSFLQYDDHQYEQIFITDISVNEDIAAIIDSRQKDSKEDWVLLDHHDTALWLNKYEWATVQIKNEDGEGTSGTSMLHEYLNLHNELYHFVENVRRYDTWEWSTVYNDEVPKHLNDLFYTYGRDRFINNVMDSLHVHYDYYFSDTDNLLIEIEQNKIKKYIEKSIEELVVKDIGAYSVGIVFGEQYISEVCHALHDEFPELDLIAMINPKSGKISYRTQRDDVNVGEFAKFFGGGGRAQTAGSQISHEQVGRMLEILFS